MILRVTRVPSMETIALKSCVISLEAVQKILPA